MKNDKQGFITLILLVLVVFSVGVVLGNTWKGAQSNEISKLLQGSELEAESFLVEQELFESFETNCELTEKRLIALTEDLSKLGKTLSAEDAKEKLGDADYNFLKRKYHLAQIRTYILLKKLQTDCGKSMDVILYYFAKNDAESSKQGMILDELVRDHDLHVFAIEMNYSKELKFLEDYYKITKAPSLVINYEKVLFGPTEKEAISPYLHG